MFASVGVRDPCLGLRVDSRGLLLGQDDGNPVTDLLPDRYLDRYDREFLYRMLVATVESLSWREYASQAVTGLYDPSGPAWASPYGSPGFGRPMPEPDQSSAVPMWRDGGPALS